jgi:hypothetical protein
MCGREQTDFLLSWRFIARDQGLGFAEKIAGKFFVHIANS